MTYIRSDRARGWNPAGFRKARIEARMTLAELSAELGVSTSTVHRWAKEATPPASMVREIARVLGVAQRRLTR